MSDHQNVVCVAINNNDRAWYEMLIPFILSLRRTSFQGHLVVIGFDLSSEKIEILRENSINVMIASEESVAVGRFIEVAKLCDMNPELQKVALYDADIYFYDHKYDLFHSIDSDELYVCIDPVKCLFITDPLIGPNKHENRRLVSDEIVSRYGGALQAGLVAGTATAWRQFAEHVRSCSARIGIDFSRQFGLDTTFLHLWAAKSGIGVLSPTQNFVTKNGLVETCDEHGVRFLTSHDGPIRGLHMTSDVRFLNAWRYFTLNPEYSLQAGQRFALIQRNMTSRPHIAAHLGEKTETLGLAVDAVDLEPEGSIDAFSDIDGVGFIATGNHEIAITSISRDKRTFVHAMYATGFPSPILSTLSLGSEQLNIAASMAQWTSMPVSVGAKIKLKSESLPGQFCKMIWIISDSNSLSQ